MSSHFAWITLVTAFLFSSFIYAQEVPVFDDEPTVNKKLDFEAFENITKLLHAGRLAPHMKCDIKVNTRKEDRKFSTGTKMIEILEVDFYPRGLFAEKKVRVLFAAQLAKYGSKMASNHWSGAGEDIKIEAQDPMQHWLRFVHDGKGNLVYLVLGNRLATYPCFVR
jgi:hypothetical protein